MCGISGYFAINSKPDKQELIHATDSLSHRGPDASGYFVENRVGLGHRRLSIIDTNARSNQPFYSEDGKYVVVFNGEIYNYKEVAISLKLETKTTSDTEVLLGAFIKLGESFVNVLNGMFSFAIYDRVNQEIWLYRDRLGIKPLYYWFDQNGLYFGSEIKAVLNFDAVRLATNINYSVISKYLHLGYIPEPETFYSGIKQLPAGHCFSVSLNKNCLTKYWDPLDCIHENLQTDQEMAEQELTDLLYKSVEYRLYCDVPFGTFLSGGVDSSLITAVASRIYPEKLKTFSIGFSDVKKDESKFAETIASYLHTDHKTFIVTENNALELIDKSIEIFDQPFADTSAIPTILVSQLAAKEVKMVLTGDGGDELFMGYGSYKWIQRMNLPFIHRLRKPISELLKLGSGRYKRVSGLFDYENFDFISSHIFSQEQYFFSENEIRHLLSAEHKGEGIIEPISFAVDRQLSPAEKQALFDLKYYLKDDLLTKVDRSSMFASLECRVPLLDYHLVEWSLNLDPCLKLRNGEGKYLLKKVLYKYLPEKFFQRPKQGFSVPLVKWLKGPLFPMINEYLSYEKVALTGILNYNLVRSIVEKFNTGSCDYLYNRIWALIVLQKMIIECRY